MRLVMVGLDGSHASAEASRWASWIAAKTSSQLIAATAWLPHQAEATPEDFADRRRQAAEVLATEWSRPARSMGTAVRPLLVDGPPDALITAADAEDVDLVVVGTRGAGGMAALHVGSVAHHLARHTTRPLAIIPAPAAHDHPGTIVVGVDGSPASAAAVRFCAEVATKASAKVIAVTAFEPFLEWVPDSDTRSWRRTLEGHLDHWAEPLRAAKLDVELKIVRDVHPVAAIGDLARDRAQLIVVGTHGRGGFSGMRLGGVAVQLVHHAVLPVVLVPAPETHDMVDAPG
jgi:nucleotide-binding universal stress UspA family protein